MVVLRGFAARRARRSRAVPRDIKNTAKGGLMGLQVRWADLSEGYATAERGSTAVVEYIHRLSDDRTH